MNITDKTIIINYKRLTSAVNGKVIEILTRQIHLHICSSIEIINHAVSVQFFFFFLFFFSSSFFVICLLHEKAICDMLRWGFLSDKRLTCQQSMSDKKNTTKNEHFYIHSIFTPDLTCENDGV